MRDINNMHDIYEFASETPPSVIKVDEVPDYTIPDWDFNDEKEFKKYMTTVEKTVRNSFEYKAMINYLREYVNMNQCSFYKNVNNIDSTKIKIEIHHDPFSLYDICLIVFNKRNQFYESLDEEAVAKEVMYLHYNMIVGLIPLSSTVHELVHNQYIFVPTSKVYGKYKEFAERYKAWMLPEQIDMLERIEAASQDYEENYQTLLSKQYIYVDMSGSFELPRTEDIINMVKGRISDIINESKMSNI